MQQRSVNKNVESQVEEEISAAPGIKRYKGTVLYTRTGFKVRGWLFLSDDCLRFESKDGLRLSMPLTGVRAQSTGAPRSLNEVKHGPKKGSQQFGWRLFGGFGWYYVGNLAWWRTGLGFYHRRRPKTCFHTNDCSIVNDPAWAAHPATKTNISRAKPWFPKTRRALWWTLVLTTLLLVFVPQVRAPIVNKSVQYISVNFDKRIGEKTYTRMRNSRSLVVITAPEVTEPFKLLIKPLLDSLPKDTERFDLNVEISIDSSINAYAIPGGHVIIHRGLLLKARTPEEAVGVVAHEIAHVTKRHTVKRLMQNVSAMIALDIIFPDEDGSDMWFVEDLSTMLTVLKFSREAEQEADELGCEYLEAARIDPQGLLFFFENLEKEDEEGGNSEAIEVFEDAFSTHPSHKNRIEYLRERTKRSSMRGKEFPADVNWAAFKAALEAVPEPTP